jgi:peptide/nickel transport system permease protein
VGNSFLGRKVVQAFLTLLFVLIVNFLLFRAMPGSAERILLRNPHISAEQLQTQRERWGLDKPVIPDQLVDYMAATAQLDLGFSFQFRGQRVTDVIAAKIGPTILLIGIGEVIALVAGLALGAYSGWRRGGAIDYGGTSLALVLYSMPSFWLGMILLIVFSTTLGMFPGNGMITPGMSGADPLARLADLTGHLILPGVTYSIGYIGQYSLLMRSSVIEVLAEDYVQTARAKGLTEGRILRSHALPNALLPTVTLVAINLGYIWAGAITIESVFSWPGLGTLTVDALESRDYPVLQGIFLVLSVSVIVANLIADIVYSRLDPRVRS